MTTDERLPFSTEHVTDFIEIPCGKCLGCRLDYSRQWADRCMLEAQYHEQNYFVTLTYDDLHVPHSSYIDDRTGEICESLTLVKPDLQKFFKRLRKAKGQFRYYACGEYGGHTMRPHYHAIIFGLNLDDLTLYKTSGGMNYYNSETLSKVWKNGFVVVSGVTWATCAYVARYVVKKAKQHDKQVYEKFHIEKEFNLMSRRPGIGSKYFEEHDMYAYDYINISTPDGGKKIKPNRYFDNKLAVVDEEAYKALKAKKIEAAKNKTLLKLSQTDNDYLSMLKVEEVVKSAKVKTLQRNRFETI